MTTADNRNQHDLCKRASGKMILFLGEKPCGSGHNAPLLDNVCGGGVTLVMTTH